MKKVTLLIAMAALVTFAGCKKDKETTGTTLKASITQNTSDRTSLHPNGTTAEIHWTAGDKILVNNGTSNATFTLTTGAGSKNGTFTYNGEYTFDENNNIAVYPETATLSGNTVSLTLPETQTFTAAGTFGNGANPMLGTFADPENLTFTSLCGVLGVSLTGDDLAITGIEIVSNTTTDKLNGLFEADCTATNPALTPATGNSGTNKVMLSCNTTLTDQAQNFYFVLPVGTLANGFTMNVYYGGSEPFSKSTTSTELAVELNKAKVMNTVNVGHEYVDLGLPSGLLWATCNIGANAPEEYGDYFAWGETTTKDTCNWSTYQYCMGSNTTLTKYCNNSSYGYNGFTDTLTTLQLSDDAARANWGGKWRMPTKEDFAELLDNNNTTKEWTTQNGVYGCLFTAKNGSGNSLFLPAAGGRSGGEPYDAGNWGHYWTSSLDTDHPSDAWQFFFGSDYFNVTYYYYRDNGYPVRPVRKN